MDRSRQFVCTNIVGRKKTSQETQAVLFIFAIELEHTGVADAYMHEFLTKWLVGKFTSPLRSCSCVLKILKYFSFIIRPALVEVLSLRYDSILNKSSNSLFFITKYCHEEVRDRPHSLSPR